MKSISLHKLYDSISSVSVEAVLNQLQIRNPSLRQYLTQQLKSKFGNGGAFLADPLIESTFGWKSASTLENINTMTDLAEKGVLTERLVRVMDQAPAHPSLKREDMKNGVTRLEYDNDFPEKDDPRWPATRPPYAHQLEAWGILGQETPTSTVVTAGTGSGKSECFIVPLLNDMSKLSEDTEGPLVGVQAIMLYPLNALINSQRDRLSAWTRGFKGDVRYALYNGDTPHEPEILSTAQEAVFNKAKPEEVTNRKDIRDTPPPILVTNATMLEYMLVRPQDRPIIEKSQGKLRWIVLDEAHTLLGSAAAETSLLLRRTMHAFGVKPENVRFVATSATIGDMNQWEETEKLLKTFLGELAGVDPSKIAVVKGHRNVPELPEYTGEVPPLSVSELEALDSGTAYDTLSQMTLILSLRKRLVDEGPKTLREIAAHLNPNVEASQIDGQMLNSALRIIDVATDAHPNGDDKTEALLPIRAHLFHRSQRGIWACINPECSGKHGTYLDEYWAFGRVYLDEHQICSYCDHPVFELSHCSSCNEPTLNAVRYLGDGQVFFRPRELDTLDDYAEDVFEYTGASDGTEAANVERDENVQLYTSLSPIDDRRQNAGGSTRGYLHPVTGLVSHDKPEGVEIRYTIASDNSGLRCGCCNQVEPHEGMTFKRAVLGAPFLMGNIVPEMLKHVPTKSDTNLRGRRLITFTDSRQGTARFSAKLQLDSERRWTRSVIYHYLIDKAPETTGAADAEIAKIEGVIKALIACGNTESIQFMQDQLEAKKAPASTLTGFSVTWDEMIDHLSKLPEIRLLAGVEGTEDALPGEYAARAEELSSTRNLARLFLLREFARRPKYSNNLESLGLVKLTYPSLDSITESEARDACRIWFEFGFTLDQWKDYLKLIVDYYVRENSLVDISPSERYWMGAEVPVRLCQPPTFKYSTENSKKDDKIQIKDLQRLAFRVFPSGGIRNRPVRLIELASGQTIEHVSDGFERIMLAVWDTLKKKELMEFVDALPDEHGFVRSGYRFRFERVSFSLIDKAYLCPITGRWLDTVMKGPSAYAPNGITPFVTGTMLLEDVKIEDKPIDVPRPDRTLLKGDNTDALKAWLEENPVITELRNNGQWRDLNDAALSYPTLLRSREHSAQQESKKLKDFERAFKNDHLNVLNCSTTMEMGVDIGSLSMVAMNNAPPATSNYLQRAGRAGRRGQSTSVVLTFCKASPHGERIFADPKWPFSATPVPRVALESAVIVSRHVNALLLATFLLKAYQNENLLVTKVGQFFVSDLEFTKCQEFLAWCDNDATRDDNLIEGLKSLRSGTALDGILPPNLMHQVATAMRDVEGHWLARHSALVDELEKTNAKVTLDDGRVVEDFAYKRLKRQLENMEKEHLLGILANRGFLPGYGFPTNVVELVTNNMVESRQKNWTDKPFGYPSRSLDVAIREYEPGKDMVLNGAVYRSAGLQLSWKIPNSEKEVQELQKIRYVAKCRCGYHSADHTLWNDLPESCPECSSFLNRMEYIVPTGFQVDFRKPLHNNYTRPEYAPYVAPLLQIDHEEWQAIGRAELGQFRATQNGNMFFYNHGKGAGFAMCWQCGRSHAIEASINTNTGTFYVNESEIGKKHKRIQGTTQKGGSECSSDKWALKVGTYNTETMEVQVPFVFGYSAQTTMLEIQLRNPETNSWVRSTELAYSLGVAMREVFCREHGISDNELGVAVQQRFAQAGGMRTSIFIFDKASQGAGYAIQMAESLPHVLVKAYEFAKACPHACDRACHACLLDFETQHQLEDLNRHAIIEYFNETRLVERLVLPDERKFFGPLSQPELLNAMSLLSLKGGRSKEIDIFISGDNWNLPSAVVLRRIKYLTMQPVRVLFHESLEDRIDSDLAWQLRRIIDSDIDVCLYSTPPILEGKALPIMRMKLQEHDYWYATEETDLLSLNGDWGNTRNLCLVASKDKSYEFEANLFDLESKAAQASIASNMGVLNNFDLLTGIHISRFGDRLLDALIETAPALEAHLKIGISKIEYFDRYLLSPVGVMLIGDLFKAFNERFGSFSAELTISYPPTNTRRPYCIADNFENSDQLLDCVSGVSNSIGLTIMSDLREKYEMDHGRKLNIELGNGTIIQILFDQGMGYWAHRKPYSRNRFDFENSFDEGADYQCKEIVVRIGSGNSYIVVYERD
ncbi:DEAD/DEAH box helicase [Pectobacterium aquaticum]|uniref:DEAD/DEAH box helicase n=1 Tax=Pectobacterium aquaticum TaxID=2204145 RepID=A0A3R8QUY0_9GAMM|nr:DEAD/DEAH box helicase [Pectobacterium aquaticum]RRN96195.1 DEAD/DEAH box helicase [Pectobacterium aquaticum]RRO11330.1 DEAD/DEAH box helicase [Pectobacterium aquaticum]